MAIIYPAVREKSAFFAQQFTMPKTSVGLIMFRRRAGKLEVLLVHPGGPFFAKKDLGAWSIPKGEPNAGEDPLVAAQREFVEETGFVASPPFVELAPAKQKGGKIVHCWAFEGDCDLTKFVSNTFEMEWPPNSGRRVSFPEADRAALFELAEAKLKINSAQAAFLDELATRLAADA